MCRANRLFIYIIGFPGSGKLSTSMELSKALDALIMDNSMFNNIAFNLIDNELFTRREVPQELWDKIFEIRAVTLKIIEQYPTPSGNYIFTNELLEGDEYDMRVYNSIMSLSEKLKAKMLPIILNCSEDALKKRISSKERHKNKKITDVDFAISRIRGKKLFVPKDALEIDNSNLKPKEAAKIIMAHIEKQYANHSTEKQLDFV
ncbi:AAA family ATPase [Candidatus Mesenet endosymbiont of Agriotes lineatus]|uniref:AAA family ATPase n=1 Tax=Candidatus Mesenet endosymbiont of Agriotes lineatus TaxID=3077948 RepID=UPI0030CD9EE4